MNKEKLLELLEDKDIQAKIKDIIGNSGDKDLEKIIEKPKEEIETLKDTICKKDEKIEKLESKNSSNLANIEKIENKNRELEKENENLKNSLKFYEENFKEELDVYKIFRAIKDKENLEGIFKDESLKGFLACGLQEKNINALWDYIKYKILEEKNENLEELKRIFDFFFERFVLANPIYKRDEVVEKEFDTHKHINATPLNPSGEIEEVLFRGYKNTKTNKPIKKSIVKVK